MKKVNLSISVASLVVFGLVGCNSNLNTSKPASPVAAKAAAKTQLAVAASSAKANTAPTSNLDMATSLPGTWICNNTLSEALSTPAQCLNGESVIIPSDLQTLDVHALNQEINSDTKSTCDIDTTYKLAAGNYASGNSMSGTLISTELSLLAGTQNDASCETDISTMNKNPSVTYAATFAISTTKTGNTLTLSLTNSKGAVLEKVYVEATPTTQEQAAPATTTTTAAATTTASTAATTTASTTAAAATSAVPVAVVPAANEAPAASAASVTK